MEQAKNRKTESLRQIILSSIRDVRETNYADASLCNLSFQSTSYSERHIWIDMCRKKIEIDLEDWNNSKEWDNTVEYHETLSLEEAVEIIDGWINNLNSETPQM